MLQVSGFGISKWKFSFSKSGTPYIKMLKMKVYQYTRRPGSAVHILLIRVTMEKYSSSVTRFSEDKETRVPDWLPKYSTIVSRRCIERITDVQHW